MPLSATSETLYFENQAGRLFYNPAGYVRLNWAAGRLPLDIIQAYYEQVLALLLQTNARRILSEHGQRAPIPPAAQDWLTHDWIPRAMQLARTRHCAIVEGADPVHRLSTQAVVSTAPTNFHFQRFTDLAEADRWLRTLQLPA